MLLPIRLSILLVLLAVLLLAILLPIRLLLIVLSTASILSLASKLIATAASSPSHRMTLKDHLDLILRLILCIRGT